jgi:hypothetical protein
MAAWTFLDYITDSGANPIEKWLSEREEDATGAILSRLISMEGMPKWPEKWATHLSGWSGLIEIRIPFNKVQYRPLGIYQPGRRFVLLRGAIEKGGKIPVSDLNAADQCRIDFLEHPYRAIRHEY